MKQKAIGDSKHAANGAEGNVVFEKLGKQGLAHRV